MKFGSSRFGVSMCGIALAGLALAAVAAAPAQDGATRKPAPAAPATDAAHDMSAMMPNEHHKKLAEMVGKWTYSGKVMPGPGMEMPTTGTAEMRSVLGGRYLIVETKGGPAMIGNYEGIGISGFDNATGKYQHIWLDNQGTTMAMATGEDDPTTGQITWHGEGPDMLTGKMATTRITSKKLSDAEFVVEQFNTIDGKESKLIEVTYTRAP